MDRLALINLFNKIKPYVLLIPALILVFFSGLCEPLIIPAGIFLSLFMLSLGTKEIFKYLLFIQFFSGYQPFFMVGLISIFVSIIVRYFIGLIRKKERLYLKELVLTVLILLAFSLFNYKVDDNGVLQGLIVYAVLIGTYLIFNYRKDINVSECVSFAFFGMVVSILMSALTFIFKSYSFAALVIDSEKVARLRLLTLNPNHLAVLCLFLISIYIYQLVNKKGVLWIDLVCGIITALIGFLSMSKAFLVVFVGFIFYTFVLLVIRYKRKSLKIIIATCVTLVVLGLIFKDLVVTFYERFFIYGNELNSIIFKITTGRSEIWQVYVTEIVSSVPKMLFGVGLFNQDMPINMPHNAYIFFLYRVGFIGIILLGLLVYFYCFDSGVKIKIKLSKILPLLTILVLCMEGMVINERFFIFLIMSLILLADQRESEQNYETIISKKIANLFKKIKRKLGKSKTSLGAQTPITEGDKTITEDKDGKTQTQTQ